MSADDAPVSSLVTQAEVARTRSLLIPAGDAVPTTHTPPTAAPHRKVTTITAAAAPLTFAANQPPSRTALIPWWSLLLSVLALSGLGGVTAWLRLPPLIGALVFVSMSFCCLVLVVAELAHRVATQRPTNR